MSTVLHVTGWLIVGLAVIACACAVFVGLTPDKGTRVRQPEPEPELEPGRVRVSLRKLRSTLALTAAPDAETARLLDIATTDAAIISQERLMGRLPPDGIPHLRSMARADRRGPGQAGPLAPLPDRNAATLVHDSAGQRAGYWTPKDGPVPCLCTRQNTEAAATTAVMDCPMHGNPGYGPGAFLPWQPPGGEHERLKAAFLAAVKRDRKHGPRVLRDCPTTFTPHDDGSGAQHTCTCEWTEGHPGKHLCPGCGAAWDLLSERIEGTGEAGGPQPYCSRPGCANRAGHWTEAHPEPDPAVKALIAERERATRLPDYVLAPDALNGHLTVDSLVDSIVMRKIGAS